VLPPTDVVGPQGVLHRDNKVRGRVLP